MLPRVNIIILFCYAHYPRHRVKWVVELSYITFKSKFMYNTKICIMLWFNYHKIYPNIRCVWCGVWGASNSEINYITGMMTFFMKCKLLKYSDNVVKVNYICIVLFREGIPMTNFWLFLMDNHLFLKIIKLQQCSFILQK